MRRQSRKQGAGAATTALLLMALLAVPPVAAEQICSGSSPDGETTLQVRIDTPESGTRIRAFAPDCQKTLDVTGFASTVGLPPDFDVYLILDRSGSTAACSGVDVDGDGYVGVDPDPYDNYTSCDDPGDTILAAEIEAAHQFVDTLSPSNSRVAVVDFSDRVFGMVRTIQSLTSDFTLVHSALDRMLSEGPNASTDFGAALEEMLTEYDRNADPARNQVALFLSDGQPTAPSAPLNERNGDENCVGGLDVCSGLLRAEEAASRDMILHTFAVGESADSEVLSKISGRTGGDHFEIDTPGEIVNILPGTSLVGVDRVVVRNNTTGQEEELEASPEGAYGTELDLVEGRNDIEVIASSDDEEPVVVHCYTDVEVACIRISCPEDPVVSCEGPDGAYVSDLAASASEPEVEITNTSPHDDTAPAGDADASGTYPLGDTDFEFYFDDEEAGNRSCMTLVSVVDDIAPELECPDPRVEPADEQCRAVLFLSADADDVCAGPGGVTVTDDGPPDGVYGLGERVVTFTAEDDAGNVSTCDTSVRVEDLAPPSLECPEPRVEDVGEETCDAVLLLTAEAADNCEEEQGLTVDDDAPDAYPLGTTVVTFTATDGAGNETSCDTTVEVRDVVAPEIVCPPDELLETPPDDEICRVPHDPEADASDLCDPDVELTDDAPQSFPLGDTTVTHRAEDDSGNASSCSQLVTVVDATSPDLICPADVTLETEPDDTDCGVPYEPTAAAADNCDGILPVNDDAPPVFPVGTTTVHFDTEDAAGNTAACEQVVTVVDVTAPILDCPKDITIETGPDDDDCLVPYDPAASAIDNCDTDVTISDDAPDYFPLGITLVTFTAADAAGNEATCTQEVTVVDTTPPRMDCPADERLETGPDDEDCMVPYEAPVTARDNCAGSVLVTNDGAGEYGLGTHVITYEAEDDAGNSATCSQTITVEDTTPPVIACPPDVVLETGPDDEDCLVPYDPEARATDNCDPDVEIRDDSPDLFGLGTTEVRFVAEDDSGNTASCSMSVTVIDTTPPRIEFPNGSESCLWPPSHRFYCYDTEDWVSVWDNCDADIEAELACLPDPPGSSASNQSEDSTGDGAFAPDCVVALDGSSGFCVRSERKGDARDHTSRMYEIGVRATDSSGNSTEESLEVRVGHDRKEHPDCFESKPKTSFGAEDGTLPPEYPQFRLPGSPGGRK